MENKNINDFLVRTFHLILNKEDRELKEAGIQNLTVNELHAIVQIAFLIENELEPTLRNLAKELDLTEGTVSIMISRLVKKGYISRKQKKQDRRKFYLNLTEKCEHPMKVHEEWHKEFVTQILENFTSDEKKTLEKLLFNVKNYLIGVDLDE
ncbi:MAG: MarR family winged helix-turn-helix transcriptional regulator [Mycoplasmatales bacterium]